MGWLSYSTYECLPPGNCNTESISDSCNDYRDSEWHHVVITKTDNNGLMWVDGKLVGGTNDLNNVFSSGDLLIGYSLSSDSYQRQFWSGKIDDIRIYNRALSRDEIQLLFAQDSIIIDNGDAGFSSGPSEWQWSQHTPGGYNTSYQYAPPGDGSKWATWLFTLENSGNCKVFAHWTAHDNRSPAAPYTITNNGTQISSVTVDQTISGGRFVSLGTYWLEAGTVEAVLNNTPIGYVIADAVKLACLGSDDSMPMTVDNTDTGFSKVGAWGTSSSVAGYYGSNYRYGAPDSGGKLAKWTFSVSQSGSYDIYAQWSAFENRSPEAPYTIKNNDVTVGVETVDQTQNGGQFNKLSTFFLEAGTVEVVLSDTPWGYVIADAVKIILK